MDSAAWTVHLVLLFVQVVFSAITVREYLVAHKRATELLAARLSEASE